MQNNKRSQRDSDSWETTVLEEGAEGFATPCQRMQPPATPPGEMQPVAAYRT